MNTVKTIFIFLMTIATITCIHNTQASWKKGLTNFMVKSAHSVNLAWHRTKNYAIAKPKQAVATVAATLAGIGCLKEIEIKPVGQYNSFEEFKNESFLTRMYRRIKSFFVESPSLTQTEGSLHDASIQATIKKCPTRFTDKQITQLLTDVMQKEKSCSNNFCFFYHTTTKENYLMQYFHTKLYEKLFDISLEEGLFLRQPHENKFTNEQWHSIREQFLKNRVSDDHQSGPFLLSVNLSPLGGIENWGDSSLLRITSASTLANGVDIGQRFEALGITSFYKQYYTEINNMIQNDCFNDNGIMLQIALPSSMVDKTTYMSRCQGKPITVLVDNKATTSMQEVLGALRINPKKITQVDENNQLISLAQDFQARIVLSGNHDEGLLNPHIVKTIKVYRYSLDNKTLQEDEKCIDQMVNNITRELKKHPVQLAAVQKQLNNWYIDTSWYSKAKQWVSSQCV